MRISVQKAHEIMGLGEATVVDIRDVNAYTDGLILQAHNVNENNIAEFIKVTDKEKPLICYCYKGISSQRTASFFAAQGYKQVYSIDGGWEEWKQVYG